MDHSSIARRAEWKPHLAYDYSRRRVAVTSVPVISKIFADLKILHTRFGSAVLGVAVLEDIVLWMALAVATALAGKAAFNPRAMSYQLIATVGFFALGLHDCSSDPSNN